MNKRRPRKRRWRRLGKEDLHRGTYIVPNLFTTANLFSGFFGIISSIDGNYYIAAWAVLLSVVFDILDGKVARLTKATSRFGVEYDSLADLVSFGVAPGVLMYLWALKPFHRLGWLAAFLFVACGALRLARFNVQTETIGKKFFVGLPIPGAASMVATSVLLLYELNIKVSAVSGLPLLLSAYLLGFLMVSTIPYYSFKDLEFIKSKPIPVLFAIIVLVTIVALIPGPSFFIGMLAYIVAGPVVYLFSNGRKDFFGGHEPLESSPAPAEETPSPERQTNGEANKEEPR